MALKCVLDLSDPVINEGFFSLISFNVAPVLISVASFETFQVRVSTTSLLFALSLVYERYTGQYD